MKNSWEMSTTISSMCLDGFVKNFNGINPKIFKQPKVRNIQGKKLLESQLLMSYKEYRSEKCQQKFDKLLRTLNFKKLRRAIAKKHYTSIHVLSLFHLPEF